MGFQNYLNENCPAVQIAEVYEMTDDSNKVTEITTSMIKKHGNIDLIYVYNSGGASVAKGVNEFGKSGKIKSIFHDLAKDTMNYLLEGTITATLSQDDSLDYLII